MSATSPAPASPPNNPTIATDVALFSALTLIGTWPQAISLTSLPWHHDAWFNVWRLAWIAHALASDPLRLFDANIFHPSTGTLAYSDAVLLQGLAGAPLIWCGLSPIVVCNLLVLASFVFAGVACTALARDLTGDSRAARLAGIVFAFAPFRFDHYYHLELLWSGWLPLIVRYGLRTISDWQPRDVLRCAASLLGQVLSCLYYGVLAGTFAAAAAALALAFGRGAPVRQRAAMLGLGALLLVAPLAAYGRPYLAASRTVGSRSVAETRAYDAAWTNYLASPASNQLYGWTEARFGGNERQLFPGAIALGLAFVGCLGRPRRVAISALVALLVAVDLARGMEGFVFPVLRALNPAIAGLRVPTRFHVFSMLALSILAALGAALAFAERSVTAARTLALLAGLGLLVEYAAAPLALAPVDAAPPAVLAQIARDKSAVVAHLPLPPPRGLPGRDPYYALLSIHHWRPLINGYSGFYPPPYRLALERAAEPSFTRSLDAVLALGATHIFVHIARLPDAQRTGVEATLVRDPRLVSGGRYAIGAEEVLLVRAAGAR
jgi:hypothetical protein